MAGGECHKGLRSLRTRTVGYRVPLLQWIRLIRLNPMLKLAGTSDLPRTVHDHPASRQFAGGAESALLGLVGRARDDGFGDPG